MVDLFKGVKANSDGTTIIMRLPITQLLFIFGSAAIVLGGVVIATRDLKTEVSNLGGSIDGLRSTVEKIAVSDRDQEIRLRLIEHEINE